MNEQEETTISEDVKHYFGFLFNRGFSIHSVKYIKQYMGYWEIVLKSIDCLIQISNDRGEISLYLRPNFEENNQIWFSINVVVFYLSKGKNFIGLFEGDLRDQNKQFQRLAQILGDYLDEIIPIMSKDFITRKKNLLEATKVVDQLYIEKYRSSKKSP